MTAFEGRNFIGGRWVDAASGRTFEQRNPARLDEVTGAFADSAAEDADAAVAAARAAFPEWRALSPQARKRHLEQALQNMRARRDEIAAVITRENGKSLREARAEVDSGLREMDYQIAEGLRVCGQTVPVEAGGTLAYSTREPLGPVGIVTPWNFPFNVPSRKCTPALMAGNTVVLKPASLTPRTALLYSELIASGGVPPGVINCVTGGGGTVGNAIVADPRIKAVSFTGSTAVGKAIQLQAARHLTPTQLELGGKNPAIVLADADLDHAVAEIVRAAYTVAGQWCTSTSRVIVVQEVAEALTAKLLAAVRSIVVRDGAAEDCGMGPVCGAQQQRDVLRYIAAGLGEGARLLCGGTALEGDGYDGGCFIAPTVFDRVTPQMTIAREEIFGPVLVIVTVRDFEEAVTIANDVAYGLASSIFTNDLTRALTYMERAEVGIAHVNLMTPMREPQLPFGGTKESGAGLPEAGSSGIEFFTHHKVCYVKYR
ncbi:MAG TPA: aldehyde dehydrogenase family protein [Gammaproteobacteria bacterium]|jgi:aldehyde dehydrogenase (NAD+)|nr:aldehyde dehydrogenase family protein [Gammaproteobacteria bacterium]